MISRWMLALAAILGSCGWDCAGSPITPTDSSLLTTETYEDTNCVVNNRGDGGAIDRCRADVKRRWDVIWSAKLGDAGATP
jgi:hypothetical protein